jgi:hypothetical protein
MEGRARWEIMTEQASMARVGGNMNSGGNHRETIHHLDLFIHLNYHPVIFRDTQHRKRKRPLVCASELKWLQSFPQ